MATGIPKRIRSLLLRLQRRLKRREPKRLAAPCHDPSQDECVQRVEVVPLEEPVGYSEQPDSSFFQKLPIEIRKTIYAYIWPGAYDHMYHVPNGRHIVFKQGRWYNMRCVMSEADEDHDLIQKNMDYIYETGHGDLLMWQRRLSSTWGYRHWRCEERIEYGQIGAIDRTDFGSMMLVCKRMYPEVVESIFESHKFIFNDLFSAHRFFVHHPSPYLPHLRHLDLTLHTPFRECSSPLVVNTPRRRSRVKQVIDSVGSLPGLHTLRVSLDICDRGPWRKLPERDLAAHLRRCRALGKFTVELPPLLLGGGGGGKTDLFDGQDLDASQDTTAATTRPSAIIVRRPPLRYWQFHPGEVERFRWETFPGENNKNDDDKHNNQPHCRITLAKTGTAISNPYLAKLDNGE
ncbi:hypothetical protein F4775DRAFT_594990 [Biscogniauxia sp. FL1348]|nr:hypothetical protein F4775DRAFT_594990 [Biscogniauxia sp. FL1348]